MKKILLVIVVIVIIAIAVMLGLGLGFGNGTGDGKGDGKPNTVQEDSKIDESEKPTEKNAEEDNKGVIIKVSVVGNEYFYENERITLDDFISKVKEIEGDLVVEVIDDKASLKAYNSLIDRLEELKASIIEK